MGSLFSGSGGFELASAIFGIEPRWASEIEPLPMLITKKNFPDMPHHGDIRYMNGGKVEAVTVIAGGSPCQDMSVAGQRAGLDGSRSNLFHEQIRIIKEMREHDRKAGRTGKYIRPRFMVWENVPGAFSSNQRKGLPSSPAGNRQRHGRYSHSSSPSERKMAECRMYHGRHLLHRLANA